MTTDTTTLHARRRQLMEQRPDLIDGALSCLLWQGSTDDGPDTEPEPYPYDECDDHSVIPADVQFQVIDALNVWLDHADGLLMSIRNDWLTDDSEWQDDPQVGHDWVLTSFGHGAGFWERYPSHKEGERDRILYRAGLVLSELAKLYPCPDVSFRLEDGQWFTS